MTLHSVSGAIRRHPDATILSALLVIGALIRLAFLFRAPAFYVGGDSQTYLLPAYELLRGGNLDLGYRRPPLYPLFLFGAMLIGGESTRAISFAQHVLGLGTIVATYLLGKHALNRMVGGLAAAGIAISGPLLVYEHYLMSEALFTLLATLAALASVRLRRSATIGCALLCGGLAGLAYLTRPAGLLLVPLVPVALLGSVTPGRFLKLSIVSLAGLLIIVAPWSAFLIARHGVPSPIGLGNNLTWRITRNDVPLISPRDSFQVSEIDAQAAAKRYALSQTARKELPDDIADGLERRFGLSEIESDRLLASTSLEVIRNRLELYLRTTGEMTLDLFVGTEQYLGGQGKEGGVDRFANPQEKYASWWNPAIRHVPQPPLATEAAEFGRSRALVGLLQPYRLAAPLFGLSFVALVAGAINRRYRAALALSLAVILGLVGAAALSGATPRFRYPYDPLIWTLASMGLCGLLESLRAAFARLRARFDRSTPGELTPA